MQINSIVMDVNVWITIFLNKQAFWFEIIVKEKKTQIFRCKELTEELKDVLGRKKFKDIFNNPISDYISIYEYYTKNLQIRRVFKDCSDTNDNYLFDLAEQSKSQYLVSGDKAVLTTMVNSPLKIISLSDFKQIFL